MTFALPKKELLPTLGNTPKYAEHSTPYPSRHAAIRGSVRFSIAQLWRHRPDDKRRHPSPRGNGDHMDVIALR